MGDTIAWFSYIVKFTEKRKCNSYVVMMPWMRAIFEPQYPDIHWITKEQAKDLMDCARWQCHDCVNSGEEARGCRLYKLLESTTPADDYGDGMVCPYALAEWKD